MNQVLSILEFAMNMEREGQAFFVDAAERVGTPSAKEMFKELARWEAAHWEYLKAQYDSVRAGKTWAPVDDAKWQDEKLAWEVFKKRGEGKSSEPSMAIAENTSDLTALRMAIFIEDDLHRFYERAMEKVASPEGKHVLGVLAEWELEHRDIIRKEYEKLEQVFWSEMGFAPF